MSADDCAKTPGTPPTEQAWAGSTLDTSLASSIAKAPFFSDPLFQQFYRQAQADAAVVDDFRRILTGGRYSIGSRDVFLSVLDDAFLLYDVAMGKRPMSELLAGFERHASPEVFLQVLAEVYKYIGLRLTEILRAMQLETDVVQ